MPVSNFGFRLMAFTFKIRDLLLPREKVLQEVEILPGYQVLDYGCGPGSYSLLAAQKVGDSGRVFALDIHPLAVKQVKKAALKKGLDNVETILSDCATGLADGSIDLILLFDILHGLNKPDEVLNELHRVLKPRGVLAFNDHHLNEDEIITGLTGGGRFKLSSRGEKTFRFTKE